MAEIFGNSLWLLVKQSDVVTKIILLILLAMSIFSWTIFLYKLIMFRMRKQQLKRALDFLKHVTTVEGLLTAADMFENTMAGELINKSLHNAKKMVRVSDLNTHIALNTSQFEYFQNLMDQTINELVSAQEEYIPFLSASAAVAPLLGLFGTIWGLIHSFVRIGELQVADIATVAPGIAEALITTLAGLLVAIPSYAMYHCAIAQLKTVEQKIVSLSENIENTLHSFCK